MSETLELLNQLIEQVSITPNDAECQAIIQNHLNKLGFLCEDFSEHDTKNLWARRGTSTPLVVFAGHTDVVSPGNHADWTYDPFTPTKKNGFLYGRGATDMKSGIAAMVIACKQFIKNNPNHKGSIAFLITSDEEGPATYGTKTVIEKLSLRGEKINFCVVGEASSIKIPGDRIRIGRRGSLHGKLTIQGKQGHVAFPENVLNPIHLAGPIIDELANTTWDKGNKFFPATTFQISNIKAGTGATNVVPGIIEILFNFRFSTATTINELKNNLNNILKKYNLKFKITWNLSGMPFLTKKGDLISAAEKTIKEVMQISPELSTGGGTSDARFIAPTGAEVIELGPSAKSAHAIDEHVQIDLLEPLTKLYQGILEKLL